MVIGGAPVWPYITAVEARRINETFFRRCIETCPPFSFGFTSIDELPRVAARFRSPSYSTHSPPGRTPVRRRPDVEQHPARRSCRRARTGRHPPEREQCHADSCPPW